MILKECSLRESLRSGVRNWRCLTRVREARCLLEAARACLVSLLTQRREIGPLKISGVKQDGVFLHATLFHVATIARPLKLGRSQVVRHRSLEPAFVGSNPPAPAKF